MTPLGERIGPLFDHAPWRTAARCRGMAAGLFYPDRGEDTMPARRVCADCPVTAECLAYAMAHHEHHGIWGGTTERERRRLRGWRISNTVGTA